LEDREKHTSDHRRMRDGGYLRPYIPLSASFIAVAVQRGLVVDTTKLAGLNRKANEP